MPSVKDFKKKNQNPESHHNKNSQSDETTKEVRPKRRPGRDEVQVTQEPLVPVVEVESVEASSEIKDEVNNQEISTQEPEKIEIHFYGSEMIRAKFPKPFDVAENIVTDWVNDGKFEKVDTGHPLADMLTQQGLKKAKEVEKKVMASPLTEKAIMKAFQVGLKAQEIVNQVKSKVQKK